MTYSRDIPQNLPSPSIAVDAIRNNFSEYANVFDNNHAAINSSNQGKHTNVILQDQLQDPEVVSGFNSLYGKSVISNSSTNSQAFARLPQFLPNAFPNNPIQLTFNSVNTTGVPYYQSFLPGGNLLFFGAIPGANVVSATITLTPTPSEILCVIPNPTKVAASGFNPSRPVAVSVTVLSASKFRIDSVFPTGTGDITWVAIARQ